MRTVAGRYLLEARIGAGGMGEVYRVRHLELGKTFALKVIAPVLAADSAMRELFHREVKLASALSHPNLVSVVDYGEDPDLGAFMVMELVHGQPLLAEQLAAPMAVHRALDILGEVADALDHIHRAGIIHGDIKADNIMIADEAPDASGARRRRSVRLLDFGLARRLGNDEYGLSGSPHYIAPERVLGGQATVATDVYALGVLGFLLFTNTLPFDGEALDVLHAQIEQTAPRIVERRGSAVDPAIVRLIERAMAKEPAARHASAAAFRYELNTVMDMLDLGRRRARASGTRRVDEEDEAAFRLVFERSPFAQALVSIDGSIVLANQAFARIADLGDEPVGHWLAETSIARALPNLMRTIQRTPSMSRSIERRVSLPSGLELVLWCGPTASPDRIHIVIRIESRSPVHSHRDSAELIG